MKYSRNRGGTLLDASLTGWCLTTWLIQPKTNCPESDAAHSGLDPSALVNSEDNPSQTSDQSELEDPSIEIP